MHLPSGVDDLFDIEAAEAPVVVFLLFAKWFLLSLRA